MKRFLASLLCLMICLPVFDFPAFAAGETAEVTVVGTCRYDWVQEELTQVNQQRAENGRGPLAIDGTLTRLAMQRAAEIAVYFSHTRPNGETCYTVTADGLSWSGSYRGENIAAGQSSVSAAMTSWMDSDGHRANILNGGFSSMGIGIFRCGNLTFWVQIFSDQGASDAPFSDPVSAAVPVRVKKEWVVRSSVQEIRPTLAAGETLVLPKLTCVNQGWEYARYTVFPAVTEVRDGAGKAAAALEGDPAAGTVTLTAKRPFSGRVALPLYEGEEEPFSFFLTVTPAPGDVNGDGDVTDRDAIHLLYHTFYPEEYPMEQDGDLNGDGDVTDADAVYLLYHTFYPAEYPLT